MATRIAALDLSVTLSDALTELTDRYEVAGRARQTIQIFDTHVTHLIDFLALDGVTTLDQVTTAHLTRFLAGEKKRGLAPASLSVILRTMRRYFQVAVEQGHLDTNPAKGVLAPSVVVEPVKFLSDDELATLLASIAKDKTVEGVRDTALIRVLMDIGLRRGEVMALTVSDVDVSDVNNALITVRARTSKTRTGRSVPIGKDTAQAMKAWLRVRAAYEARRATDSGDALWVGSKGPLSPNGALQAFYRRLDAAGLPRVSLHSLRHRMAALAIQKGLPMTYLMKIGGWRSAELPTQRYGQYGVESRAIEAMRALLDG